MTQQVGQQRLGRVQVVNWGTFDGVWSFGMPRRGLLLTGPSGAGKSSLLDAIAAILVKPARMRFNAAAQGAEIGDRERNLVTYVRGAYKRETDETTGEVATAFLRKGATWSAVALTFDDGGGTITTLIRCFHLRASSTDPRDLASMYVLAPESVDVLALKPYAENGIENRRVRAAFPNWEVFSGDAYSGFSGKFRRRLGLASEQAQLLLHKTQSAKNLTSLDALFRDFMLDEPETFKLSRQTVEQFEELSVAHATVVDARCQVEVLGPLRGLGQQLTQLDADLAGLAEQETHLVAFLTGRRLVETAADLAVAEPTLTRLDEELHGAEQQLQDADAARQHAQRAVDGSGGAELSLLQERAQELVDDLARRERRATDLSGVARRLDLEMPTSSEGLARFREALRVAEAENLAVVQSHGQEKYAAFGRLSQARQRTREVADALESLRRHRSNLDPRLLDVRELLAGKLQVSPATLPFVGELIQVRADQSDWTGAIERVLGSFARTLIVPEQHYLAAAEVIDAEFLGARLVYEKVPAVVAAGGRAEFGQRSLIGKLELAESVHHDWLAERIGRRFDYACVDHPREFGDWGRAVTRQGQVKHSATLHEKDDRRRVDDRSRWVLGFSTETKEAELGGRHEQAQAEVTSATNQLAELEGQGGALERRRDDIKQLSGLTWDELDTEPLQRRIQRNKVQLDQLRVDHAQLSALEVELEKAIRHADDCEGQRRRLAAKRDQAEERVKQTRAALARLRDELAMAPPVPSEIGQALTQRAAQFASKAERLEVELREVLVRQTRQVERSRQATVGNSSRRMADYQRSWPGQAADWSAEVEYLPEYLARLTDLEEDRLPEFENRFFDLLQRQARNNISQLAMQIKAARREIRSRVGEVNRSLLLTQFSPGGYLQIEVRDRRLPEVDAFLGTLQEITSGSVADVFASDNPDDRRQAEVRFELMRELLQKLGSDDPANRTWRDKCLDTRQHVQFQASVEDADGRQLDVFTGSGGRSGGERQKLVTFCLAAALRYQLAPAGQTEPSYALVIIDEAFDKADHAFTRAGLEVFKKFGFQMLLATPMKMLQTIDDYVGGVVMVSNESGRASILQELPFQNDAPPTEPGTDAGALQEALV